MASFGEFLSPHSEIPKWANEGEFRRDTGRLLASRLRIAVDVAFASITLFMLVGLFLNPEQGAAFAAASVLQCLGLTLALLASLRLKNYQQLRIVGLMTFFWIIACSMIVVVGSEDISSFAEGLICLELGAALLIPWGVGIQALASATAIAAYLFAMALPNHRDLDTLVEGLWVLFGGGLALFATHLLEQARRELFARSIREREVISSFSHDIRAPASAISMQAELINELSEDAGIRSRVQTIRASATQVLNLAQNMVDSIRIEEGEMDIRPEAFDLNRLVSETVSEQESLARVKRIELVLQLAPNLPMINSDPFQLKRVLINLLTNALNVTPPRGRVLLSTTLTPEWVRFSLKDGGPGLGAEEREQLFVRYSALARRSGGGVGLGLFIVKDIVARCGGRIEIDSSPGEGSTFSVLLPRARTEEKQGCVLKLAGSRPA